LGQLQTEPKSPARLSKGLSAKNRNAASLFSSPRARQSPDWREWHDADYQNGTSKT